VRRIRLDDRTGDILRDDIDEMEIDLNRWVWYEYPEGTAIVLAEVSRTEDGRAVRMGGGGTLAHLILMPTGDPDVYDLARIKISRDRMDAVTVADRGRRAEGHWRLETPARRADDFIVVLLDSYNEQPGKVKERINRAWAPVKRGRNVRTTVKDGTRLALLQPTEPEASTQNELNELNDQLEEAGCGRASADPYETKQLRKLLSIEGR
jgi:hypothetical protein